jgi:hypothetical protein
MTTETPALFTASAIAKNLGVVDTKVKEAIKALNIEPAAQKGCRVYFTADAVGKIEAMLKK